MPSKVKGEKSFRRIMRGMPDSMRGQIVGVFRGAGPELARAMQARAPRGRTGRLIAGLKYRVYEKSLRLTVGVIGPKSARARIFYARILDLGRKAQTVTIRKGPRAGSTMRVRAIAAQRFVTGRYPELRKSLNSRLRGVWDRGLRSIAGANNRD